MNLCFLRSLKICALRGLFLLTLLGSAVAADTTNSACNSIEALRSRVSELIAAPKYQEAFWGIKIVSLDTGKTLFEHNPEKLFSPASNTKLYTVAMALDRLGPDYRIKTSLLTRARPDASGTLEGDLLVYGRGDMTVNGRRYDGDIMKALEPLVAAVTNAGVRTIDGDLVCDQSYFRGPEFGSGWAWDDLEYYYGAEISALTINDNIVRVTVRPAKQPGEPCSIELTPATSYLSISNRTSTRAAGGRRSLDFYRPLEGNTVYVSGSLPVDGGPYTEEVTVHDPGTFFGFLFRAALAEQGVPVKGRVRALGWRDRQVAPLDPAQMIELGSVESLPLRDIARETLKISQNLYTDLLLAHVGEAFRRADDPPEMTSEECGVRELKRFATEAGIAPKEYFFEEGSGLSRDTLVTPEATVKLLNFMSRHKNAEVFLEALPLAGVDGSLRNRMKGTAAAGKLRAKTGSLRWASSLSGYVTSAAGERLVFSLMLNRYQPVAGTSSRAGLDAIGVLLAGLNARSE